jgi:hypothetical protein
MNALIPLLVVLNPFLDGFSAQTDWSDGQGVPGPVTNFGKTFASHQYMAYEDMPGELFLHLQGEKHQVTNYLEYSVPGSVVDMNGDGHLDVVCGSNGYSKRKVYWFENDGSGGGWERHDVSGTGEVTYPWSVCAADVDGDGDMDVICGDNDKIVLWINTDGTGLNWEASIIADNLQPAILQVVTADMDADSYQDILVMYGGGDGGFFWYENPLRGGDSLPVDDWTEHFVGEKDWPKQICVADINGDGWMDVVCASGESSNKDVSWWQNLDGTGDSWAERTILNNINNGKAIHVADMDGDGDLDVIAMGWNNLYWFENNDGLGTSWTNHQVPGAYAGSQAVLAVDIFGYGLPVILGAYGTSGTPLRFVLWERMDEGGLTWRMHILEKSFWYNGLAVGDIDGDGTLDVVTFEDGSRVFWFSLGYPSTGSLTSSILNVNNYPHWDEMQWQDSVPAGSSVRFRVRSSNDPGDMGEWSGYIEEPGSLEGFVDSTHRYFQYRVHMEPSGRFVTPTLYQVLFYWDWLGVEGAEGETCLHPVTPNPSSGPVEIRFSLAEPGSVAIQVFDLCGRLVSLPVDGELSGGEHSVQLASLPPGAYFVRMTAGEEVLRERFVLLGDR